MIKPRAQDVLLLALAVVTAAAIYVALGSTRATSPQSDTEPDAAVTDTAVTQTALPATDQDVETPGSTTAPTEAAESTDSPEPAQQDAVTASEGSPDAHDRVAQILAGEDDDAVDVVVLGDDTSNLRSEWVHLWAQELSATREVTVIHWDETIDIQYAEPDVLSQTGAGGPLTIWSASRTGADIESATQRLGLFLEPDPDLVLLSLGANNDDPDTAVQQLQALVDELQDQLGDTPVALVRQGAGGTSDEVDQALADWAEEQGLFVVDARFAGSSQEWAELVVEQTSP